MTRQEILTIAKPILFNTEMVRAVLDGRKTATRRVVKPQPELKGRLWTLGGAKWSDGVESVCPMIGHSLYNRIPYKPDDYLYVRETWRMQNYGYHADTDTYDEQELEYRADLSDIENEMYGRRGGCAPCQWHPSLHMPKEAARIFLRVTDVRVERLREIDHAIKIAAEGADIGEHCCQCIDNYVHPCCTDEGEGGRNECGMLDDIRCNFVYLWDSTIKKQDFARYGWAANPWVWVIEFERVIIP